MVVHIRTYIFQTKIPFTLFSFCNQFKLKLKNWIKWENSSRWLSTIGLISLEFKFGYPIIIINIIPLFPGNVSIVINDTQYNYISISPFGDRSTGAFPIKSLLFHLRNLWKTQFNVHRKGFNNNNSFCFTKLQPFPLSLYIDYNYRTNRIGSSRASNYNIVVCITSIRKIKTICNGCLTFILKTVNWIEIRNIET